MKFRFKVKSVTSEMKFRDETGSHSVFHCVIHSKPKLSGAESGVNNTK